jgi:hypothetical protein
LSRVTDKVTVNEHNVALRCRSSIIVVSSATVIIVVIIERCVTRHRGVSIVIRFVEEQRTRQRPRRQLH